MVIELRKKSVVSLMVVGLRGRNRNVLKPNEIKTRFFILRRMLKWTIPFYRDCCELFISFSDSNKITKRIKRSKSISEDVRFIWDNVSKTEFVHKMSGSRQKKKIAFSLKKVLTKRVFFTKILDICTCH